MANRTPTNIMVNIIDFSSLEDAATDQLNRQAERFKIKLKDGETVKAKISHTWGFVETTEGIYVLCDEGVGNDAAVQTFEFDVHHETVGANGKVNGFGMFPISSVKQTPEQIRERASGERIELSEFIRTFGSRLDSNFRSWEKKLGPIASEVLA